MSRCSGAGSVPSLCSSDHAEVVTDDGAAAAAPRNNSDDAVVAEAFRVKAALSNAHEKSDADLLELLQRLRQLEFTVDAIRATEIGMAVKPLRKHASKQIRQLEEWGLPSPPMDEAALFAAPCTSIQLSED
nr:unnamed protein product [Digitaria exilis]